MQTRFLVPHFWLLQKVVKLKFVLVKLLVEKSVGIFLSMIWEIFLELVLNVSLGIFQSIFVNKYLFVASNITAADNYDFVYICVTVF